MSKIARKLLFKSELGLKSTVVFTKFSALPDPDIANSTLVKDTLTTYLLFYFCCTAMCVIYLMVKQDGGKQN